MRIAPAQLKSALFCGKAVQYDSTTPSPFPGATVEERSSEDSPLHESKMNLRELPMKRLAVAMMLVGSMFAQTTQNSEAPVTPKPPTINIGIALQLGMSRDSTIPQLAARYKVVKIQGDDDEWIVEEKHDPMPTIGHLRFTAGKLTYASRIWTQGQGDNYTFAQALWGAMSQMDREDQHACSFEVPASRSPAAEMSYVRLYCGPNEDRHHGHQRFGRDGKETLHLYFRGAEFRRV
jgi:hypothetical protein